MGFNAASALTTRPQLETGSRLPDSTGGAQAEAETLGVPLLAEIPIEIAHRQAGHDCAPLTAVDGTSAAAETFRAAAKALF
jgi:ATP-binding protein involved in chromosome partitioning